MSEMTLTASLRLACALALTLMFGGCAQFEKAPEKSPDNATSAEAPGEKMVVAYEVTIDAPSALRDLLQEYLDIVRFRRTPEAERPSAAELQRLALASPAQARSLLEVAGYFDAKVTVDPVREQPGKQTVVLHVVPGEPVRVSGVEITLSPTNANANASPPAPLDAALLQKIRRQWKLGEGDVFAQDRWSAAKTAALVLARGSGYPLAQWAQTDARVEIASHRAALSLQLDTGPLFHLGALHIEGLKRVPASAVQRLSDFKPGQPYTEQALIDFQQRLQKTQLFDIVTVDIGREADEAAATPVNVTVREAPHQQSTTGVGYDANAGQHVTLEYLNRQPLGLDLRSDTKLDLGREQSSAEIDLLGYPLANQQRNQASLQLQRTDTSGVIVTSLDLRVGRSRETERNERLVYLEGIRALQSSSLGDVRAGALLGNVQWTWRQLDSPLLPTDGISTRLLLGAGHADANNANNGAFGRYDLQSVLYHPLGAGFFGSAHTEFGQVVASPSVGIPEPLLYRAGGEDSVRGYAYQSLGPTVNSVAVGGRALWTGGLEVSHALMSQMPELLGAAFIDAGNAAPSWSQLRPVVGIGFGVRYRSPVGPLRVDIARGQATGSWRLDFTVGIPL